MKRKGVAALALARPIGNYSPFSTCLSRTKDLIIDLSLPTKIERGGGRVSSAQYAAMNKK